MYLLCGAPHGRTLRDAFGNKNAIDSLTKEPVCVDHLFPAAREASDSDAV